MNIEDLKAIVSLFDHSSLMELHLQQEGVATYPLRDYPNALQLVERGNIFKTQAFADGLFEVQDASSQKVARFMMIDSNVKRVIDTCAGAGPGFGPSPSL